MSKEHLQDIGSIKCKTLNKLWMVINRSKNKINDLLLKLKILLYNKYS